MESSANQLQSQTGNLKKNARFRPPITVRLGDVLMEPKVMAAVREPGVLERWATENTETDKAADRMALQQEVS